MTIYVFAPSHTLFAEYCRAVLDVNDRGLGIHWIGEIRHLEGRRFEQDDELHFVETDLMTHALQICSYVSMMLGMCHPMEPRIVWECSTPQERWLPSLPPPLHDRLQLEAWLEA